MIFVIKKQNSVAEIGAYIGKRGLVSRTPSHAGNANTTAVRREDSEEQRQPLAEIVLLHGVSIAHGQEYASIEGIQGGSYLVTAHWGHENCQFKPREYNRIVLTPSSAQFKPMDGPFMTFDIPQKGGPNDGPLQGFCLTLWRRQQGFHADELLGSTDNVPLPKIKLTRFTTKRFTSICFKFRFPSRSHLQLVQLQNRSS